MRVGLLGFRGYTGAELLRILHRHPDVELRLFEHREPSSRPVGAGGGRGAFSDKALAKARRAMSQPFAASPAGEATGETLPCSAEAVREAGIAVLLLATPPEASLELAPVFLAAGARVIDLSGGFRLRTPADYERWYGVEHAHPALLEEAVYGLSELHRTAIRGARLVANPGCYATVASLALQPLVAAGVVDRAASIVCDAKSGISGAGERPTAKTHFCAVSENLSAYGFLDHRHVPEILGTVGLDETEFSFVTQLVPVQRGILATIHLRTARPMTWEALAAVYQAAYAGEPFVRLYPAGTFPSLQAVAHSNFCDIGIEVDPATRRVILVAAIDNLVKGAAGQAVQNLNLMLGLPEGRALL